MEKAMMQKSKKYVQHSGYTKEFSDALALLMEKYEKVMRIKKLTYSRKRNIEKLSRFKSY